MHLLMLHERERCLKPCLAHVPEHDPRKLLYCIYVRLQPQINLLSCLRNVPLKKKSNYPAGLCHSGWWSTCSQLR